MSDYQAVRSSLDISRSIAFYLEMSDIRNPHFGNRANIIRICNDILQGRSETTTPEDLLSDLEQMGGSYYAREIAGVRRDVQAFLHQKELLAVPYNKDGSKPFRYRMHNSGTGKPLKVVNQHIFDAAAKRGFPYGFFRETYFDQVTIYCLPDKADFFCSVLQNCTFAVCRISGASFDGVNIYSSEFHSTHMDHLTFFQATISNTHFHDCDLFHVSFQNARMKSCNTIDCVLSNINYLNATLDSCSYGRICPSGIRNLETALITQGGATHEECRRNRSGIFRALGVEEEAA